MQILEFSPHSPDPEAAEAFMRHDSSVEIRVDNIDDLYLLKNALGDYIFINKSSSDPNQAMLQQAQDLKDRLTDDVVELQEGTAEILPISYIVEEKDLVTDALKIAAYRDRQILSAPEPDADYAWLSSPDQTHEAALTGRFHTARDRQVAQF
jgi:dsDNA-binding SOS-regulon protein